MTDAPALRIRPPAWLADPALAAVLAALPRARLVGGCVRDELAGQPVADIDLATPDTPEETIRLLQQAGLKSVPTGLAHGTITAVSGHRGFEITSLRHDVATDGRRAQVAFTEDWRADAARRDFTINALSMIRDGDVHDYFDGIADLRAGRVRFVGDPATRIAEDYLRILRFFRFYARFGHGDADPAALSTIRAAIPGLARLSAERVWSELKRILAVPDPMPALALMQETGILAAILPEGTDLGRLASLIATGAPADPILRLAALLTGDPTALATRLRLATAEAARLQSLRATDTPSPDADDADLRRRLADTDKDILTGAIWLAGGNPIQLSRIAVLPVPVFPLQGRDLRRAGIPAGPELGAILRDLRAWWMAGGCTADLQACRAELTRRLKK